MTKGERRLQSRRVLRSGLQVLFVSTNSIDVALPLLARRAVCRHCDRDRFHVPRTRGCARSRFSLPDKLVQRRFDEPRSQLLPSSADFLVFFSRCRSDRGELRMSRLCVRSQLPPILGEKIDQRARGLFSVPPPTRNQTRSRAFARPFSSRSLKAAGRQHRVKQDAFCASLSLFLSPLLLFAHISHMHRIQNLTQWLILLNFYYIDQ